MIFFKLSAYFFKDHIIKNPQTTIALPFLTHNISAIGGVYIYCDDSTLLWSLGLLSKSHLLPTSILYILGYILLSNHLKYPTCHSLTRKCHIQLCDLLRNTESEDCDSVIYCRMIVYEFHKAFNTY